MALDGRGEARHQRLHGHRAQVGADRAGAPLGGAGLARDVDQPGHRARAGRRVHLPEVAGELDLPACEAVGARRDDGVERTGLTGKIVPPDYVAAR